MKVYRFKQGVGWLRGGEGFEALSLAWHWLPFVLLDTEFVSLGRSFRVGMTDEQAVRSPFNCVKWL